MQKANADAGWKLETVMENVQWYGAENVQVSEKSGVRGYHLLGVLALGNVQLHVWKNADGDTVGAWFVPGGTLVGLVAAGKA